MTFLGVEPVAPRVEEAVASTRCPIPRVGDGARGLPGRSVRARPIRPIVGPARKGLLDAADRVVWRRHRRRPAGRCPTEPSPVSERDAGDEQAAEERRQPRRVRRGEQHRGHGRDQAVNDGEAPPRGGRCRCRVREVRGGLEPDPRAESGVSRFPSHRGRRSDPQPPKPCGNVCSSRPATVATHVALPVHHGRPGSRPRPGGREDGPAERDSRPREPLEAGRRGPMADGTRVPRGDRLCI